MTASPEPSPPEDIARLIADLKAETVGLDGPDATAEIVCDPDAWRQIVSAWQRPHRKPRERVSTVWAGTVTSDLVLGIGQFTGGLELNGATVLGDIAIESGQDIPGSLELIGTKVMGSLMLEASIRSGLVVRGDTEIHGDVALRASSSVTGDLIFGGTARVTGRVQMTGKARLQQGSLKTTDDAEIVGGLHIDQEAVVHAVELEGKSRLSCIKIQDAKVGQWVSIEGFCQVGEPDDGGDLELSRITCPRVRVVGSAHLHGNATLYSPRSIDHIHLGSSAVIDRNLGLAHSGEDGTTCEVGRLDLSDTARVKGQLAVSGVRLDELTLRDGSSVGRHLAVTNGAHVRKLDVDVPATVGGPLSISPGARVDSMMVRSGRVGGGIEIGGELGGGELGLLEAPTADPESDGRLRVASLRGATLAGDLFIGDWTDLSRCDFGGFTAYERLRFIGAGTFHPRRTGYRGRSVRQQVLDLESAAERESVYRRLRRKLEAEGNRPASSDFYFGEMKARQEQATGFGKALLWVYWVISAYGTRAWRATSAMVVLVVLGAVSFAAAGWNPADCPGPDDCQAVSSSFWEGWDWTERGDVLLFSVRSAVSFFSPPEAHLTNAEQWVQLALRFIGPLLIAQMVLSLRERVAR